MNQTDNRDRRQAYRYQPPPVMTPLVSLIHGGRRIAADRVIDVNLRGARVELSGDTDQPVASGSEVTVTVQAPGLDGCADIPARVVFSARRGERRVLALVFTAEPDVSDRSDPAFFSVFNRRQERRVDGVTAVSAMLLTGDDDDGESVELEVVNHSERGIGFVVDPDLDRRIRGRAALDLAIRTDEDDQPQPRTARVLHRASNANAVYYGCMFAA